VIWGGDWETDPGDVEILSIAKSEERVLITLDKDFCELAIVRRIPYCGIIRLVNISAKNQGKMCMKILERFGGELEKGAIVTCDEKRIRINGSLFFPLVTVYGNHLLAETTMPPHPH